MSDNGEKGVTLKKLIGGNKNPFVSSEALHAAIGDLANDDRFKVFIQCLQMDLGAVEEAQKACFNERDNEGIYEKNGAKLALIGAINKLDEVKDLALGEAQNTEQENELEENKY